MALQIQYDADGCEGMLSRIDESSLPSVRTLFLWAIVVAVLAAGGTLISQASEGVQVLALMFSPFAAIAIILGLGSGLASFQWQGALHEVRERFEVRQGVLTLHAEDGVRTAPLAGAKVTAFEDGVWVNPALGEPLRLVWDGATSQDVSALTEALEAASRAALTHRGTSRDVPQDLARIRD